MMITQGAVVVVAGIACACDLRTRRIPNVLTFGAAITALVFHVFTAGAGGAGASAAGWAVGVVLLFPAFALGGLGAGDVKLLGALGAWLGPGDAVWLVLYTGISGGVMAVIVGYSGGYLRQACRNVWLLLVHWRVAGLTPLPELTLYTSRGPRLAYAAPIMVATIATLWLR